MKTHKEEDTPPGILRRFFYGVKYKLRLGYKQVRYGESLVYYKYWRLRGFRGLVRLFRKIPAHFLTKNILNIFFAIIFSSFVLKAYPSSANNLEALRDLISSGLLIAPLVGMLNGGFSNIISLYLNVFDKNSSGNIILEPRFMKIKKNIAFLENIESGFETMHYYIAEVNDAISTSVSHRSDAQFKNALSTIGLGILIMFGFLTLLLNCIPIALFILSMIYIKLIFKQVNVYRTSIKQGLIEDLLFGIKKAHAAHTKQGSSFIKHFG